MTFTIAAFRAAFPEFNNIAVYPDAMITFWSGIAVMQVNQNRWCQMWLNGVFLYVAHEITLAAQNVQATGIGGIPGTQGGPISNKAVGGVSIGYDTSAIIPKDANDAGFWNQTLYGRQFYDLNQMFGSGCVQL